MSRLLRIIEASDAFARARKRAELYQPIVEHAGRFGFTRIRLYEGIPGEERLYGRAVILGDLEQGGPGQRIQNT